MAVVSMTRNRLIAPIFQTGLTNRKKNPRSPSLNRAFWGAGALMIDPAVRRALLSLLTME
jgi:hypothetical protein